MQTKTDLMHHQSLAVEKLAPTRVGALFMDMGTGKTRTAIELIKIRYNKIDNIVWLCPVSLKLTVLNEILKHTDIDKNEILVFNEKTNENNYKWYKIYIVGIESISSSNRCFFTLNKLLTINTFVIVDESSYIKGYTALRTKRITISCEKCKYKLILTGTPISQGVVDLYSQMKFLSTKILGYSSFYSFSANHLEYSSKYPGMIVRSLNTEWIAKKIKPYVYQVKKEECIDLPGKIYKQFICSLTDNQRYYYEQIKKDTFNDIECLDSDYRISILILRLFTKLQQITSGLYKIIGTELYLESNRLDSLYRAISSIPINDKIIIWCKYEHDIKCISELLSDEFGEDSYSLYYGKKTEKERDIELLKFKDYRRFFISTQSCGGHGLTINESSYTIFYNNSFKYSERMQAEDRNYRIGQNNKITYIDIRCDCGIEDKIFKALENKSDVVSSFSHEVDKVKDKKSKIKKIIKKL